MKEGGKKQGDTNIHKQTTNNKQHTHTHTYMKTDREGQEEYGVCQLLRIEHPSMRINRTTRKRDHHTVRQTERGTHTSTMLQKHTHKHRYWGIECPRWRGTDRQTGRERERESTRNSNPPILKKGSEYPLLSLASNSCPSKLLNTTRNLVLDMMRMMCVCACVCVCLSTTRRTLQPYLLPP